MGVIINKITGKIIHPFRLQISPFIKTKNLAGLSLFTGLHEPETIAYRDRVEADGGVVINIEYVNDCYKMLKVNNLLGNLLYYTTPSAGIKKDSAGYISKIYSLIESTDMVQTTGAYQPLFQADTMGGKPNIYYDGGDYFSPVLLPVIPTKASIFQVARRTTGTFQDMLWCFGTANHNSIDLWNKLDSSLGINNYNSNCYGINDAHLFLNNNFIIKSELHSGDFLSFNMMINGVQRVSDFSDGTHDTNRSINQSFNLCSGHSGMYSWTGYNADTLILDRVLTTSENNAVNNHLNQNYTIY